MGANGTSDRDRQLPGFSEFARELHGNEELVYVAAQELERGLHSGAARGMCSGERRAQQGRSAVSFGMSSALSTGRLCVADQGGKILAQANRAATGGGHIETSSCRGVE
jgi:hypothetical protein